MAPSKKSIPAADLSALEDLAETLPSTQPKRKKTKKAKSVDSALTVKIPDYVHKDLKVEAAKIGKSQREIVLEALQGWGLKVKDEDILDRRTKQ